MVNSRQKGARGERELAKAMTEIFGCVARRGQQYSGSPDSPDVITDIPGIHIECKRVEKLNLYDALHQSKRDSGNGEVPVVIHRKNGMEWVLIVELDTLPKLANIIETYMNENETQRRTDATQIQNNEHNKTGEQ